MKLKTHTSDAALRPAPQPANGTPHIFREISLELFTPHYGTSKSHLADFKQEQEVGMPVSNGQSDCPKLKKESEPRGKQEEGPGEGDEPTYYSYPCRCSASFIITFDQLEQGVNVIGCEGCGEWIRVGYEVVEDEDEDGEGGE